MRSQFKSKLTTLFWLAMASLFLTTIYSVILLNQGYKTKKMINYMYKKIKQSQEESSS